MNRSYLARSATEHTPPQSYFEHVWNVLIRGRGYLRKVFLYAKGWDAKKVLRVYELAAEYHDLGKLDGENQKALLRPWNKRASRLPLPHADPGVAYLMSSEEFLSMMLVYAHHAGLPDFNEMENGKEWRNNTIQEHVNNALPDYLSRHEASVRPNLRFKESRKEMPMLKPADIRALFACLTHADHGDAARATNEEPKWSKPPKLRAAERLLALQQYVDSLAQGGAESDRNQLRSAFFVDCSKQQQKSSITFCDAPVGTGKTTAVMANLLATAASRNLRRIFVVLPFTNIITQSVEVYRKALVLPGERPEDVVAEIHHQADFEDMASRKLTALWDAPIVVTTAVAFFETLASATPSTLRRLQNLPGSAVFLDEAHAMLPVKLLPLAWQWIQHAASTWSCSWVLASGSLCHFWDLEEFGETHFQPVNILPSERQKQLQGFESRRVHYRFKPESMNLDELAKWLKELAGPVIVVLNTVHTAAAAAKKAEVFFGSGNIYHLSTSLTAKDREHTFKLVKSRLKKGDDKNWCLIATSCVEAGVDLSFRTGVRESASLLSLLQLAGRVNRNGENGTTDVWTIILNGNDPGVLRHPAFNVSSRILGDLFSQDQEISPDLCTEAMLREIRESAAFSSELPKQENIYAFKTVERRFKVIEDDAQTVVVDPVLIQRIRDFENISWREIQTGSVRVREKILKKLAIEQSRRYPGIWLWEAEYSPFLGYMEAVLRLDKITEDSFAIT